MNTNAVALFSDTQMLPGLHVTVWSLLNALEPEERAKFDLHIFLDGVSSSEKNLIRSTCEQNGDYQRVHIHDFAPKAPPGGNALHGNQTAYGRLFLATLLNEYEKCIYLDSDLVVNRSVVELFDQFDGLSVILVADTGARYYSVDRALFNAAQLPLDGPYFNTGVLGIDLDLWRKRGVTDACFVVAKKFKGLSKSADQGLLNTVLFDSFKEVGRCWNWPMAWNSEPLTKLEKKIYHFVASPKPWDLGGKQLHPNYQVWFQIYRKTAIGEVPHLNYSTMKRKFLISKSLFRAWKTKVLYSLKAL